MAYSELKNISYRRYLSVDSLGFFQRSNLQIIRDIEDDLSDRQKGSYDNYPCAEIDEAAKTG